LLEARKEIEELAHAKAIEPDLKREIENERERIRKELAKMHAIEREAKWIEPVKLEKELLEARKKIEELHHEHEEKISFRERINRLNSMKEGIKEELDEMKKEIEEELSPQEAYNLERKIEKAKSRIKEIDNLIRLSLQKTSRSFLK
jgi:DNA anti-recombination protein RmuC